MSCRSGRPSPLGCTGRGPSSLVRGTRSVGGTLATVRLDAPADPARRSRSPAARAAAPLSRLARRGGGTTLPGQAPLEARSRARSTGSRPPAAGLRAHLGDERQDDDRGDGAEILAPRVRARAQRSGANLVSGVASTLLAAARRRARPVRGRRGARCRRSRAACGRGRCCLGNLFRDQLDRYGELELIAERWRAAVARCPAAHARRQRRRPAGRRPRPRARGRPASSASTTRACAAGAPARGRLEVLPPLRHALRLRGRLRRASRRLPLPGLRARAARARRRRARDRAATGSSGSRSTSSTPAGTRRVRLALPGLYNVYNALGAASLALALGAPLDEIVSGLERFCAAFGRFERIAIGDRRLLMLLIKNPAGANEAVRTLVDGGAPRRRGRGAERRDRRRARRLVDLGRRLRAAARRPRPARRDRRRAPPSWRCASRTAASSATASRSSRRSAPRSTAGSSSRRRAASSSSCRPTRRCSRCGGSSPRAATCELLGGAA